MQVYFFVPPSTSVPGRYGSPRRIADSTRPRGGLPCSRFGFPFWDNKDLDHRNHKSTIGYFNESYSISKIGRTLPTAFDRGGNHTTWLPAPVKDGTSAPRHLDICRLIRNELPYCGVDSILGYDWSYVGRSSSLRWMFTISDSQHP